MHFGATLAWKRLPLLLIVDGVYAAVSGLAASFYFCIIRVTFPCCCVACHSAVVIRLEVPTCKLRIRRLQ